MSKTNSIKKNFAYNLVYNILNIIIPLITAPYTSRVLGADRIGIYSFTNSLITTVCMIGALGSQTYGQLKIAAAKDEKERNSYFWEIFFIKAFTTILSSLLFFIYASLDRYFVYFMIQIPFLLAYVIDISWLFQGVEKFNYIAIRNTLVRIAGIILLFIFVKEPNDLWKYLTIIGGSQFLGNLSMWPYAKQYVKSPVFDKSRIVFHLKNLMVYFIPTVTYQIYAVLDKAMLGWIVGSEYENGFYEQAYKIVNMVVSVVSAYTIVMRSRMAYLYSNGEKEEIVRKLKQSSDAIAFMVFPMSFGLALIAANMVPWFFGAGYNPVITLLYIFCPIFVFMGYSRLIGTHILTPSGRQGKSNIAQCAAAAANLVLNLILIPKYQAFGAAIASVIAEFIIVVVYYYMVRAEFSITVVISTCWKKFLASLIMFLICWKFAVAMKTTILSTFVIILFGTVVYTVILCVMKDAFLLDNLVKFKERISKWVKLEK